MGQPEQAKISICDVMIWSTRDHFGAFTTDAQINFGLGLANRPQDAIKRRFN